jgi:hypothetical protein
MMMMIIIITIIIHYHPLSSIIPLLSHVSPFIIRPSLCGLPRQKKTYQNTRTGGAPSLELQSWLKHVYNYNITRIYDRYIMIYHIYGLQ